LAKASRKKRTRRTRVPRRNNPPVGTVLAFVALGALAAGGAWYYFSKPKPAEELKTKKGKTRIRQEDVLGTFQTSMQTPPSQMRQSLTAKQLMDAPIYTGRKDRTAEEVPAAAGGASAPEGASAPGASNPTDGTRAP